MDIIIQNKINELEQKLKTIDSFLQKAPEGSLKIHKSNEKPFYYQQYRNPDSKEFKKRYIKKKDIKKAKELAQKSYYLSVKPIIEKNVEALKRFRNEFSNDAINSIYDDMIPERKELVIPIQRSKNTIINQWNKEVYEPNMKYPENLKYETENGEMVRSKSELIIANALFRERKNLLYRYEQPVVLLLNGREITFNPDFKIINLHTGKITYWEHAGKMDDPIYANDFVSKMNIFQANNIIPGRNLVVTYETRDNPLSVHSVRMCINELK